MNKGSVKLRTSITSSADPSGGTRQFTLKIDVTEESPFDESISDMSPAACFLYDQNDVFARVCTLDDFLTIKEGRRTGSYRLSSFTQVYNGFNAPAAEQKDLQSKITTFYNNLNTYVASYADQTQTIKEYIIPDYTDERLDTLIARWRAVKVSLAGKEAELAVKKGPYASAMNQAKILADELKKASEKIFILNKRAVDKHAELDQATDTLDKARSTLLDFHLLSKLQLQTTQKQASNITMLENSINNLITNPVFNQNATNQAIRDSNMQAINRSLNAIKSANMALEDNYTQASTPQLTGTNSIASGLINSGTLNTPGLNPVTMPVNLTGLDLKFSFNKITSLLGTIKLINLDEFDASSEIKALKDAITNVCNTVDNQLETLDAEIEALNASVEADKSTMQALEAQMKQIRPSIDLANPETAWFLTVNITNRQRG